MKTDWFPSNRTDQLAMARNWVDRITENTPDWGITTQQNNQLRLLAADAC